MGFTLVFTCAKDLYLLTNQLTLELPGKFRLAERALTSVVGVGGVGQRGPGPRRARKFRASTPATRSELLQAEVRSVGIGRLKALEQELSRRLGLSRTVSAKPGAPDLGPGWPDVPGVANWRPCEFDWKPRSENGFN